MGFGRGLRVLVLVGATAVPGSAAARPCADSEPFIVKGQSYVVYTGDSKEERNRLTCHDARVMVRRWLVKHVQPSNGFVCKTRRFSEDGSSGDCHDGPFLRNEYGYWQYLVGWYPYRPH